METAGRMARPGDAGEEMPFCKWTCVRSAGLLLNGLVNEQRSMLICPPARKHVPSAQVGRRIPGSATPASRHFHQDYQMASIPGHMLICRPMRGWPPAQRGQLSAASSIGPGKRPLYGRRIKVAGPRRFHQLTAYGRLLRCPRLMRQLGKRRDGRGHGGRRAIDQLEETDL